MKSQQQSQTDCQAHHAMQRLSSSASVQNLGDLSSADVWNDDGLNSDETRGSNDIHHDIQPSGVTNTTRNN